MSKLRTVFLGTPDFSVPTLNFLHKHQNIELVSVISMPDRPAGRGKQLKSPEVIEFAKENSIPYFQTSNINKDIDFIANLKNEDIDLIIVLAFAQFLGEKILNLPKIGSFNIHTSILPKYRGAAPIQYALLNGDKETGVSIQKMVKKMDAGDLVAFSTVVIEPTETGGTLYDKLKIEAPDTLQNLITNILNDDIKYSPQNEDNVSFAPTLKKEDGKIDFPRKTRIEIENQIKALSPWPGTWCLLNGKRLKVFGITDSDYKCEPGEVKTKNNKIAIGCKDSTIRLCDIQIEGKKRTSDKDFINGFKDEININKE